jgi:hypothetical protein
MIGQDLLEEAYKMDYYLKNLPKTGWVKNKFLSKCNKLVDRTSMMEEEKQLGYKN